MRTLLSYTLLTAFSVCLPACGTRSHEDRIHPEHLASLRSDVHVPEFDGDRAFEYLLRQTSFGPRAPGSPGHRNCQQFLYGELGRYADSIWVQQFLFTDAKGKAYRLANIIASFNARNTDRILLSAHWDTRPWADQDADPGNRETPILGANDGASGVAVLLEIARHLGAAPPPVGVDIVLFDGEDLGKTGRPESFSVGARYFARNKAASFNPKFGINIDMVGDRNLRIAREAHSERYAQEILSSVFAAARELDIHQFIDVPGDEVYDDHIPLNEVGIRTVNLIDFDYPDESNRYWHTLADTPDKCSPESLAAVGRVLLHVIYRKAPYIP